MADPDWLSAAPIIRPAAPAAAGDDDEPEWLKAAPIVKRAGEVAPQMAGPVPIEAASAPPAAPPKSPEGYNFTDYVQGSIPLADEAGALGGAVGKWLRGGGWDYSGQLEKQRAPHAAYQAANPWTAFGGDVLAGAAFAPGRLGASAALRATSAVTPTGASSFAPAAQRFAAQPAQWGEQVLLGAKQAAIAGGLTGAAGEGDLGERAMAGGIGAGIGGVIGTAIPLGIEAVKQPFARTLSAYRGYTNPEGYGMDQAVQSLQRGGRSAPDLQADLDVARMGGAPDITLADIGGRSPQNLVRSAVNIPGRAVDEVGEFLEGRQLDAQHRVANKLQQHWGGPQVNVYDEAERLAEHARTTAGPIYDQAYVTAPPVDVGNVVQYIDSVISPGATGLARPRADLDRDTISGKLARVRRMFMTDRNQRVGLQELHRVKMDIDGMIEAARGETGSKGTLARELVRIKQRLLQAMDTASPEYGRARAIYSDDLQMQRALDLGRDFRGEDPEVIERMLAAMTPAERSNYRAGAYRNITDLLGKDDMAAVYDKMFKGPVNRNQTRAVFQGDDAAFNDFQRFMLNERLQTRTARAAGGGSTTAAQQKAIDDAGMDAGAVVRFGEQVASGGVIRATIGAISKAVNKLGGWNEESAAATARLLLSTDPAVQAQVLAQLGNARTQAGTAVRPLIERMMAIGGATAVGSNLK